VLFRSTGLYLQKDILGKYQIIINFLALIQSVAVFIVSPFVKDIYRMNNVSIRKLEQRIGSYGIIISFPFIFLIYFALSYFYGFNLSPDYILYFMLFVIPVYLYIVPVYNLYKNGSQNKVMIITIGGIIVNLISGILLIPVLELKGALISNIISQLFMILAYYYENSKIFLKLSAEKN
jgi:O-antigen/teichoic acid export membrane protein